MKKSFLLILIVALLFPFAVCAEEEILLPEAEPSVARIGNDELAFINRQDYYDLSYKYPGEFELEIKEDSDRTRHVLSYFSEGYEKPAVKLVISRTNEYTPETRLTDVSFIDQITAEEINGVPWRVGTQTDTSNGSVTIYVCGAGEYTYTFTFSSDYPADFDFSAFAEAFIREVKPAL